MFFNTYCYFFRIFELFVGPADWGPVGCLGQENVFADNSILHLPPHTVHQDPQHGLLCAASHLWGLYGQLQVSQHITVSPPCPDNCAGLSAHMRLASSDLHCAVKKYQSTTSYNRQLQFSLLMVFDLKARYNFFVFIF